MESALKNMAGSRATDVSFVDADGTEGNLLAFVEKAAETLVLFYDPECPTCKDLIHILAADDYLNTAITAGDMQVIAMYPDGKTDHWQQDAPTMPANWTVARSREPIDEEYDLPVIPIVYVIDSSGIVLAKDLQL